MHEAFSEIRRIVERLVVRRDPGRAARCLAAKDRSAIRGRSPPRRVQDRDGFARVMAKAMQTRVGDDADKVLKVLADKGITRALAKDALEFANQSGRFTVFALVDALTRLSSRMKFAGDRADADAKASSLLAIAA